MGKMEQKISTTTLVYSLLVASISSLLFGFNLTFASLVEPFVGKEGSIIKMSRFSWAVFKAVNLIGGLCGNLLINNFNFPRKYVLVLANTISVIGYSTILLKYTVLLITGRFITGIGIGIIASTVPAYLGSISSYNNRGMICSFHQLFITLGVLVGYLYDYIFSGKDQMNLSVVLIVSFIIVHSLALLLISSGRHTINKGKSLNELLSNKKALKSIIMSMIFHAGQQLSGIQAIVMSSKTIFSGSDQEKNTKTIILGVAQFVTTFVELDLLRS